MTKKTNNPQIETAASDPVMARFGRMAVALADTGGVIPRLLAEQRQLQAKLGKLEITGGDPQGTKERLNAVGDELAAATRQRAVATESLLGLSGALREARASAGQELAGIAASALADFMSRWNRTVAELGRLHSEAAMLSRALRTPVSVMPPYTATLSADGTRMQVVFSGSLQVDGVRLSDEASAVTARLDRLDSAMSLCASIEQAREWDQRYIVMQRTRSGAMPVMTGVYIVNKRFTHLGGEFEPGDLVDQTLMGPGILHRRWMAKELLPLESAVTAAA